MEHHTSYKETQFKADKKEKKTTLFQKIRNMKEVVALTVLLSLVSVDSAFSQEQEESPEKMKEKMELLKQQAEEYEKTIFVAMDEKGLEGKMGETKVRKLTTPENDQLVAGYSDDEQPEWLIHENEDASMRFFDEGADGSVDKVIINKDEATSGGNVKSAFNDIKTFAPISDLAENAGVTASLDPENVRVYEINVNGEIYTIRSVDFQSGEASELTGDDAEQLALNVQNAFTKSLEQSSK